MEKNNEIRVKEIRGYGRVTETGSGKISQMKNDSQPLFADPYQREALGRGGSGGNSSSNCLPGVILGNAELKNRFFDVGIWKGSIENTSTLKESIQKQLMASPDPGRGTSIDKTPEGKSGRLHNEFMTNNSGDEDGGDVRLHSYDGLNNSLSYKETPLTKFAGLSSNPEKFTSNCDTLDKINFDQVINITDSKSEFDGLSTQKLMNVHDHGPAHATSEKFHPAPEPSQTFSCSSNNKLPYFY